MIFDSASDEARITFDSVPEFFATGANSFTIILRADGSATIAYGAMSATDGLAGATEGGGAADPGETDLSSAGFIPASGTSYEQFGFGDENDLSNTTLQLVP